MTSEQVFWVLMGLYLLGAVFRVFWPYILANLQEKIRFNWRMVTGQAIVAVLGLLGFFGGKDAMEAIRELMGATAIVDVTLFLLAFIGGFGSASFGRNGQKTIDAVRKNGSS